MRVDFEDGNWIEIRPIQTLKARDRDVMAAAVRLNMPFTEDGDVDMDKLVLSGGIKAVQRNALIAQLIQGWSFEYVDDEYGRTGVLPIPRWNGEMQQVENEESIELLPIDGIIDIETVLDPYMKKINRKPTPKETITANSNGTSRGRVSTSPKGSGTRHSGTSSSSSSTA